MKIFKNRLVIGCICIILAFAIGFLGVPYITNLLNDKVPVLVATRNITKGEELSASDFRTIKMTVGDLPYNVGEYYGDAEFLKDSIWYAAVEMRSNDIVTKSKVSSDKPFDDEAFRELSEGEFAVAVTVDTLSGSIGAKVTVGDIVTPMLYDGETSFIDSRIRYLEVISVVSSDAADINGGEGSAKGMPSVVIFKTNQEQALALADYEKSSKIHLALVSRGDDSKAAALLAQQAAVFGEKPVQSAEVNTNEGAAE